MEMKGKYMKYKNFFLSMIIIILIVSITSMISPILIQLWAKDSTGLTLNRIFIIFIILLLSMLIQLLFIYLREKFAKDFNIRNCAKLLKKYMDLNYDTINDDGPKKLIEKIAISVNSFYSYYTNQAINLWASILTVIFILSLTAYNNIYIAVLLFILLPINYLGYKSLNNKLVIKSQALTEASSSGWQEINSVVAQVDYIKQLSYHNVIIDNLMPSISKIYTAMADINVFAQTVSRVLGSVNSISNTMINIIVVFQVVQHGNSPLILILYNMLLPIYFSQIDNITNANLNKRDLIVANKFDKYLTDKQEANGVKTIEGINKITLKIPKLTIKEQLLATEINENYTKGDIVWVKGMSGAGKSTLLKLIPKFRTVESIFVNDNIDVNDIDNASLRSHIDYLSQNVPIVSGTVRDNLFLGKPYSSTVENLLKSEEILKSLWENKTMDSIISENGSNLSGGEKQKLAIARALYNNSNVLILDEITSNIDKDTSDAIYERITKDTANKIIFIISHDDLPCKYANKSIVLEK